MRFKYHTNDLKITYLEMCEDDVKNVYGHQSIVIADSQEPLHH